MKKDYDKKKEEEAKQAELEEGKINAKTKGGGNVPQTDMSTVPTQPGDPGYFRDKNNEM